jgi:DnaJ-class molecular chaperone
VMTGTANGNMHFMSVSLCGDCKGEGFQVVNPCDYCEGQGYHVFKEKMAFTIKREEEKDEDDV